MAKSPEANLIRRHSLTVALQSNFHNYPLLAFGEMPAVATYIIPSTEEPSGIGAMANAV